jgi:hypothetical protein
MPGKSVPPASVAAIPRGGRGSPSNRKGAVSSAFGEAPGGLEPPTSYLPMEVSSHNHWKRPAAASILQASGFRGDVTVFRLNAAVVGESCSEPGGAGRRRRRRRPRRQTRRTRPPSPPGRLRRRPPRIRPRIASRACGRPGSTRRPRGRRFRRPQGRGGRECRRQVVGDPSAACELCVLASRFELCDLLVRYVLDPSLPERVENALRELLRDRDQRRHRADYIDLRGFPDPAVYEIVVQQERTFEGSGRALERVAEDPDQDRPGLEPGERVAHALGAGERVVLETVPRSPEWPRSRNRQPARRRGRQPRKTGGRW